VASCVGAGVLWKKLLAMVRWSRMYSPYS
jgi:hypothetical protein